MSRPLPKFEDRAPDAVFSPPQEGPSEAESALGICRKLRSKLAFLPLRNPAGEPLYWQNGDGGTAVYWCLQTMECGGPDDGLAHATLCRSGRSCYEPLGS